MALETNSGCLLPAAFGIACKQKPLRNRARDVQQELNPSVLLIQDLAIGRKLVANISCAKLIDRKQSISAMVHATQKMMLFGKVRGLLVELQNKMRKSDMYETKSLEITSPKDHFDM